VNGPSAVHLVTRHLPSPVTQQAIAQHQAEHTFVPHRQNRTDFAPDTARAGSPPLPERLFADKRAADLRVAQMRDDAHKAEMKDCTFSPRLVAKQFP
jgi:hypothetical protein